MGPRALAAGLLILGSGCSSVHTELEIPAKPEAIWSVLTDAPGYEALSAAIKTGSRLAIWLSERV